MRIALLGASRGLGYEVAKLSLNFNELLLSSRKLEPLQTLVEDKKNTELYSCDFSLNSAVLDLVKKIKQFQPHRIWYFAGGGPFGNFGEKNWQDHQWAWQVSFLTPALLLHSFLKENFLECEQIVFVGSSVAEDQADPKAASYCSAKHALKGLISTVNLESNNKDIRLFSPSYMDTKLLPPNAYPRQQGKKILSPTLVADVFWNWALNSDGEKHFRYS
ncbi:MAG: SDR family oxidoreductase [Bdellovibrionaceae bacterium]|nr:SDR family oxidoreductase [Pseudobdellovibrionaceae bacterium]